MDPITHLSSGVMGGLAFRRWFPEAKYFMAFCILCSWIPDADIFFDGGNPEFSLLYHRGITTSIAGALVMALVMAGLYKLVSRGTPYVKAALLAYGLMLTHVWLDLITTYGTQILAPFSNHRFALDGAFIIDPVFTGIALVIIGLTFFLKKSKHRIAMAGMAWFFAYPLMNMGIGAYLETWYARHLDGYGITYESVHVTPDALTPRYWKVVTTTGDDYLLDTIDLFGDDAAVPMERHRRADVGLLEKLGEQASMFSTYAWFSKWPTVKDLPTPNGREIVFHDLRFHSTNPVLRRIFKEGRSPFKLTAHIDENGLLTGWQFEKGASSMGRQLEQ